MMPEQMNDVVSLRKFLYFFVMFVMNQLLDCVQMVSRYLVATKFYTQNVVAGERVS